MQNNLAIESFIAKYRLAVKSKSKDIRITIEEAADIVSGIALMTNSTVGLSNVEKKLDDLSKKIDNINIIPVAHNPAIDGGGF